MERVCDKKCAKNFFRATSQLLKSQFDCDGHIFMCHFKSWSLNFHDFIPVFVTNICLLTGICHNKTIKAKSNTTNKKEL